jgi:hypothetical protein
MKYVETICMTPHWNELSFDINNFTLIGILFSSIGEKITIISLRNGSGNLTCGDTGKKICTGLR